MAYPTGELSVDLRAIADNWRYIKSQLNEQTACGAVVKANAYGLGVDRISPKLYEAGCRDFFVANLKEAMQLLSFIGPDANIYVLSGCNRGAEHEFIRRGIIPVIVSAEMLFRWAECSGGGFEKGAVLKVDTGMGRFGVGMEELGALLEDQSVFQRANINCVMSHLACADDQSHAQNNRQLERFEDVRRMFAERNIRVSTTLANSSGVFLSGKAHCDIARPGIALFGGNPGLEKNPMQPVVGLRLPIVQVKCLPKGESVGYGATKCFDEDRHLAVVSGGYADGILRSLSNRGWGYLDGCKVPIVGKVSMDSTTFDVTEVANTQGIREGASIEILGKNVSIDDLADAASTISYEILTSFGSRYERCYME